MVTEEMVRELLAASPHLDSDAIEVVVKQRRVTLRGRVPTQREYDEAEETVRVVAGVEDVDNQLVVTGEPI